MSKTIQDVVVIDALRTPVGRIRGSLSSVRPDDLGAIPIKALVERTGIDPEKIGEVFWGCANQAGEDNRNVGRMSALLAGLPQSVPATTINRLCGSSLDAIQQASRMLALGDAEFVIAGGVESMSRAPLSLPKGAFPFANGNRTAWDTTLGWRYPNPKLEAMFPLEGMGETAENIQERTGASREMQDQFALESHRKAVEAQDAGRFEAEICQVDVVGRKGRVTEVLSDEGPRRESSMEALAKLRAVFRQGGSVTAGNSSSLNDGASAILLASRDAAESAGLKPIAKIRSSATAGVDPRVMGLGPIPASRIALVRAGLSIDELDLVELNEAFAVQSLAVIEELGLDTNIVNVNGGAIALGHPLGCSGARIVTTLLHEMQKRGPECRYGLATMCIGVGQGIASVFERL